MQFHASSSFAFVEQSERRLPRLRSVLSFGNNVTTSQPKLETSIRAYLQPSLKEDGFSGCGRTFRRVQSRLVQVVNIQGSRHGGQFAINLGIQPVDIPDILGREPDQKKITEPDCEFRKRLSESGVDQWWTHDSTPAGMDAAVQDAAAVYIRCGRPLLNLLGGADSPIFSITPKDMPTFRDILRGFGSTDSRIALALARLRKAGGRMDEARAFAAYGLDHVGKAASLRAHLEEICHEK